MFSIDIAGKHRFLDVGSGVDEAGLDTSFPRVAADAGRSAEEYRQKLPDQVVAKVVFAEVAKAALGRIASLDEIKEILAAEGTELFHCQRILQIKFEMHLRAGVSDDCELHVW